MRTLILLLLTILPAFGQVGLRSPAFVAKLGGDVGGGGGGGGCPSGLLVSYKADNSLNDSQGANHLTDPNLDVKYTNTISNQGFWFTTGYASELEKTDTADLSMGVANKSWSWWFYSEDSGNDFIAHFSKMEAGGNNAEYQVYIDSADKLTFSLYDSGGTPASVVSTATISINTWYHVVVTYDSSDLKMYINNGSPDTAAATSSRDTGSSFWVGIAPASGAKFTGIVDEIQIYSTTLTAGNVTALYNGGTPLQCP